MAVWLFSGCLLIFIMVSVGGITRLTGSGLSITGWKLIRGTIPPLNEAQWQEEFENYKQIPQYKEQNYYFTLEDFKSIYWWEFIHRFIGRVIGIVFIIPFLWFWKHGKISKELMPKLLLLFFLGALQGFLGWYMVKSGLTQNVRVSHIRLAIHLSNAFITFGLAYWLMLEVSRKPKNTATILLPTHYRMAWIVTGIVFLQIIYGAFVAGTKAGHIYNTFPKMGTEWIASSVTYAFEQNGLSALVNDISVVQFVHRTIAWLIVLTILGWWYFFNFKTPMPKTNSQRAGIRFLAMMVILQFLLGIFTILYSVPVWLGVVHQAGAFFLFAGSLFLIHRFTVPKSAVVSVN